MKLEELRQNLADAICGSRFETKTYFVGGCVRNQLLRRPIQLSDVDIAVELPDGGIALANFLAEKEGLSQPKTHPDFGTASMEYLGIQLEFVMTRGEHYRPGSRFPEVRFATLVEDCLRRDFTVNALYMKIVDGTILDPDGRGLRDLEKRLLRSIREPRKSFQEDPLRILRALRFAAVLDLEIEKQTWEALRESASLIQNLSQNNIQDEMKRMNQTITPTQSKRWEELTKLCAISIK
ncbi:MAG: CCA tRNA nucleotidyltransferase [Candidatus Cloacimonadaceae bacterium]|nr:CCA tRNA nucleotidyltransferase [Candidatus Cloacimonadota bacterium]MDX9949578.1 CCA tRNA nucleotidyltransferase [Candidatus Syntrophosphaera sp.]NLN84569.1 CCA tRNA nucleotidyltransferase [Candidatus Cloacimonadota bacterium]